MDHLPRPLLLLIALLAAPVARAEPAREPGIVGFHAEPISILSERQKADLGVAGDHDVVVAAVVPKGPAAKAGLRIGDRLRTFGPHEVPDLHSRERDEAHHLWRVAMRMMLANARVGEPLEIGVERDGVLHTCTLTPVSAEEMHRLQADDAWREPPPLADAGPARPLHIDFQGLAAGTALPEGFHPYEGSWRVVREGEGENAVLRQDRMTIPWAVLLVAGEGRCYGDATARVRFRPVAGVVDASAGIIFRAQDPLNYYVVRPNALEPNFRIYIVKDGVRTELASLDVAPPERGTWHEFTVTFRGPVLRATLDGTHVVEARDATFASGWCGLWTKADSVTLFDDLQVAPEGSQ